MTEILLIRHGETEFNLEGRMQGHQDSPLTERGRSQAAALGRRLRSSPAPRAWVVSPLGRTRETSAIIREAMGTANPPPERLEDDVREINCGEYEGRLKSELDASRLRRIQGEADVAYPGGESLLDVMGRAERFLGDSVFRGEGMIVLITHGNFGRAFGGVVTGLGSAFTLGSLLDNTGCCRFVSQPTTGETVAPDRAERRFLLQGWNDISHLNPN